MRDVNGLSYWQWANAADFDLSEAPTLAWDFARQGLVLQGTSHVPESTATLADVQDRADRPAMVVDAFGAHARLVDGALVAFGQDGSATPIAPEVDDGRVHDLDWTPDGQVILALQGETDAVLWRDTLARFDPVVLTETGFAPDRVAVPATSGPIWLFSRRTGALRVLKGAPEPRSLDGFVAPQTVFTPTPEVADPPRLEAAPVATAGARRALDACADANGALVILHQTDGSAQPENRLEVIWPDGHRLMRTLSGVRRGFSIAPYAPGLVALICPDWTEARIYKLPARDAAETGALLPLGLRLPMRDWTGERLCRGASGKAHYPQTGAVAFRVLAPLSTASHAEHGAPAVLTVDSGVDDFVWHRLYLEAQLPEGCRITVLARAGNLRDDRAQALWHPHQFGGQADGSGPRGVWMDAGSEHPHGRSALSCARAPDRAGLFTCLLQKSAEEADNTRLSGRYLQLHVTLHGNRARTPVLHALRAWGPRFSYRDAYLPALFSINDGPGAAGSDFLDRYLALFESVLTPMEGEIAQMWRGASAAGAPEEALDWLARWIGITPDSALGTEGKRRMIGQAARLAPWHGTLKGLQDTLDVATNGAVSRGEVIAVENFRMRRTFATILGADFSDRNDPMTRGTRANGNSHLGPGFFVGSEDQKQLFALFGPALLQHDLTTSEDRATARAQLDALFADAAHRVTVLVHPDLDADLDGLVRRIVARETPAHVVADIVTAPASLILGLSALLGVETRLGTPPGPGPVTIGATRIGQGRLTGTPSLDPTLG